MKKTGVITALDVEREQFEEIFGKPLKTDLYGHFLISEYSYNGNIFYLARSGVGEIHASACTQLLISVYGVDVIFNYGFAGCIKGYKIGENVLVNSVVHYDFDTSAIDNCEVGRYLMFDGVRIPTDQRLRELAKECYPDLKEGVCASADKFVADVAAKERLFNDFGATLCEMECAAVLIVSKNAGIPALIVKVISDSASGDEYCDFVSLVKTTKSLFADFLKSMLDKIALN